MDLLIGNTLWLLPLFLYMAEDFRGTEGWLLISTALLKAAVNQDLNHGPGKTYGAIYMCLLE